MDFHDAWRTVSGESRESIRWLGELSTNSEFFASFFYTFFVELKQVNMLIQKIYGTVL